MAFWWRLSALGKHLKARKTASDSRNGRATSAKRTPAPDRRRQLSRLKGLAILLVLIQLAALGLKGWQDQRTASLSETSRLAERAELLTGRLLAHKSAMDAVLQIGTSAGLGSLAMETGGPVPERIFRLEPAGPRRGLATAATLEMAKQLRAERREIGFADADIVTVSALPSGIWATVAPLRGILPPVRPDEAIILTGPAGNVPEVIGTPSMVERLGSPSEQTDYALSDAGNWHRLLEGCHTEPVSQVKACINVAKPILDIGGAFRTAALALLLLAPTFAILGLIVLLRERDSRAAVAKDDQETEVDGPDPSAFSAARAGWWRTQPAADGVTVGGLLAELCGCADGSALPTRGFAAALMPSDPAGLELALAQALERGGLNVTIRLGESETARSIELRGRVIESETGKVMSGMAFDVTDRVRREALGHLAEQRLKDALEAYQGPVALWDERKRLLFWNAAFQRIFGFAEGTLRPGLSRDIVSVQMSKVIRLDRPKEGARHVREIQLLAGGWLNMTDQTSGQGVTLTICHDITASYTEKDASLRNEKKLRRLLQELQVSEGRASELTRKYAEEKTKAELASSAKGNFLANMSHELRTPLNAINGFSEILAKQMFGPLGDPRYQEYAASINLSGQHLLDMINDILDMAKIESGKMTINPKPIDPVEPVDAAIRMIQRRAADKNITLVLDDNHDVPEIEADHRAIKQMVLNLVSNAIKFTPEGGKVTVRLTPEGDMIAIRVIDTGVGIPEKDLPKLANPFEQATNKDEADTKGTGLGLALTKAFAEMHGGRFDIESKLGSGTTVSIYLPVIVPEPAQTNAA